MKNKKKSLVVGSRTTLSNKTGPWRTIKPLTDYQICISCQLCAKICPEACIEMAETAEFPGKLKPKTDYDYCKGCALCVHECPVKAIKMVKDY